MPAHHTITDPHIHEPKGVASAPAGTCYVSNGSGSGAWLASFLGAAQYEHNPAGDQAITTTPSRLLIDASGPLTYTGSLPRELRGGQGFWNSTLNRIAPVRVGDGYQVSLYVPIVDSSGSPTAITVDVDISGATSPNSIYLTRDFEAASFTLPLSFLVTDQTMVDNGLQFFLSVDTGTVEVGSPSIYITKSVDGTY